MEHAADGGEPPLPAGQSQALPKEGAAGEEQGQGAPPQPLASSPHGSGSSADGHPVMGAGDPAVRHSI